MDQTKESIKAKEHNKVNAPVYNIEDKKECKIIINLDKWFLTSDNFPQFKVLEENYKEILEEVLNNVKNEKIEEEKKTFESWCETDLYSKSKADGWEIAPIKLAGMNIEERCKKFPVLSKYISPIKNIMAAGFSLLKDGTHIIPHKGYDDYSKKNYRYHLGLVVPEGDIALRCEDEAMKWQEGKAFIFDDSYEHEAWNFTGKNRLVLIVDFLKKDDPNNLQVVDKECLFATKQYF